MLVYLMSEYVIFLLLRLLLLSLQIKKHILDELREKRLNKNRKEKKTSQ